MTRTSAEAGLNYNIPRVPDPISAEITDSSREKASGSNAFDRMLVVLAGDIKPHEQSVHIKEQDESNLPAEAMESIPRVRAFIQETITQENQQYQSFDVYVRDQEVEFKAEENETDQSKHREIPDLFEPISNPASVTFRNIFAGSAELNAAILRKKSPFGFNEAGKLESIPQEIRKIPEIINFASIETHLPPLINNLAREIRADFTDIAPRELRESDKINSHAPIKILKINLHPIELGALAVRIRMSGTTMQVEILAESKETAMLLSHVREKILHNMTQAGSEAAKTELKIGFGVTPPPNDSSASADPAHQERYEGGERQGGFNHNQPDRRRAEISNDSHRSDDKEIAFSDFFHDSVFI